jgi:hypothetical protein
MGKLIKLSDHFVRVHGLRLILPGREILLSRHRAKELAEMFHCILSGVKQCTGAAGFVLHQEMQFQAGSRRKRWVCRFECEGKSFPLPRRKVEELAYSLVTNADRLRVVGDRR